MTSSTIPARVRAAVLMRDGYHCIAPDIDAHAGWCRDAFGNPITRWRDRDPGPTYLQMSHTKDADELAMGKKAEADSQHLVTLCPFHHTGTTAGSNWEAVHRNQIRKWLTEMYSPVRSYRR
jgi:hypothetical protein